jgi:hypothetical protein
MIPALTESGMTWSDQVTAGMPVAGASSRTRLRNRHRQRHLNHLISNALFFCAHFRIACAKPLSFSQVEICSLGWRSSKQRNASAAIRSEVCPYANPLFLRSFGFKFLNRRNLAWNRVRKAFHMRSLGRRVGWGRGMGVPLLHQPLPSDSSPSAAVPPLPAGVLLLPAAGP